MKNTTQLLTILSAVLMLTSASVFAGEKDEEKSGDSCIKYATTPTKVLPGERPATESAVPVAAPATVTTSGR